MMRLALALFITGCTSATPAPRPRPIPAPPAEPPIVLLSERERADDSAWLASFGLDVPDGGLLLAEPFRPPFTRRSFIVPTAWYRAQSPTTVMPADLAADLDLLAIAFPRVYGGYERARARGFDFDAWLARWRARLEAAGDTPLPLADAFAPIFELMAVQLDNHTGLAVTPYIRFGSGSKTALLRSMPTAPCTRMRTTAGAEHDLDPDDRAHQPRQARRYDGTGRMQPQPHIVYPNARGTLAAVLCGTSWIEADAIEAAGVTDMLSLLDRTSPEEDAPAYRALAPDVGYLRLPTFSKRASEKLRVLAEALPASAGEERALIVDLRFNDGGDGGSAFPLLSRWVDIEALTSIRLARTEKQSCLVDALMWGYTQKTMASMTPPISGDLRSMIQSQLDELASPSPEGCPVTVDTTEASWSYEQRRFEPARGKPVLLVLVNEECGSDCEYIAMLLASRSEAIIAGTNTFGVAEFVQPSYMILPRTRVTFRMARGTSQAYGDGRSFDGYGLDPDILFTSRAATTRAALLRLARQLVPR